MRRSKPWRSPRRHAVLVALCLLSAAEIQAQRADESAWMGMDRPTLTVVVELASGPPSDQGRQRGEILNALYRQIEAVDAERAFAPDLFTVPPDENFTTPVASDSTRLIDALVSVRQSYARFRGAERAGNREWMSKHLTAGKQLALSAADSLLGSAHTAQEQARTLRSEPLAMRRPLESASAAMATLEREGFPPELRKLLLESGRTDGEINAFHAAVTARAPEEVGISVIELYQLIAEFRRGLAAELAGFARTGIPVSAPLSNSFVVGNPHDREETIDLFIRRVSIPEEWQLSIVELEPTPAVTQPTRVQEIEAGKHYRVRLPSKAEIRVASVVVAIGPPGENTTARWAVEGKIGDELLGGMVHEMHLPDMLPDSALPSIAPATVAVPPEASTQAPDSGRRRMLLIGGGVLLVLSAVVTVLRRYRRKNV